MKWKYLPLTIAMSLGLFGRQASAAGNDAAAEALFGEAKKLAAAGNFAEACPKFAESNRLDRGAGTMIHLGDCYEKNHQSASAWATFKEAASAAQALSRADWERLANQRAVALESKLAHLKIDVASPTAQLEVSRDGITVAPATFGVAIPVDVGPHAVEAHAPGYRSFKTTLNVAKDGEDAVLSIPALEPEATASNSEAPATEHTTSGRRTAGFVVAGVGVAALATGAVTGLMAMSKSHDAKSVCASDGPCTSRSAVDSSDSAKTFALVSTVGFIAGIVGVGVGTALVLTSPTKSSERATAATKIRFSPELGPQHAGFDLSGSF